MPKDFRMKRICDLMRTTLTNVLMRDTEDLRFHDVTITSMVVSKDLGHAKVYVSFVNEHDEKDMIKALNHAAKFLRYQLAQEITLRVTPELRFYYDDSNVRGARIMSLLNKALKGKE